jgi:hypothetical protein
VSETNPRIYLSPTSIAALRKAAPLAGLSLQEAVNRAVQAYAEAVLAGAHDDTVTVLHFGGGRLVRKEIHV